VLTITLSAKRLVHLKHATEQVGGTHLFWFAMLSDVIQRAILSEPFWWVAGNDSASPLVSPLSGMTKP